MPPKSRAGNRNFGIEGAGKGDADRTDNKEQFAQNFSEIKFDRVPCKQDQQFQKTKRGYRKTYGGK